MPMGEFHTWLAYRRKYGPMNPVRMHDTGPALIASILSRAHGGSAQPKDFMPYPIKQDFVSNDEFIAALSKAGGVKIGR